MSFSERIENARRAVSESVSKSEYVIDRAQNELLRDPRFTEIRDFLQGEELNDMAHTIATKFWYKERATRESQVLQEQPPTRRAYSNNGNEALYTAFENFSTYQSLPMIADPEELRSRVIFPDPLIRPKVFKLNSLKREADLMDFDIENHSLDENELVAKLVETTLIAGGIVSFRGGSRIIPVHYKASSSQSYKGECVTLFVRKESIKLPIGIDIHAGLDPFDGRIVYRTEEYRSKMLHSPEEFFQDIAARIANGEHLEDAYSNPTGPSQSLSSIKFI